MSGPSLNVLSVWLQDHPRGADFAAAHLASLSAHVATCPQLTAERVRCRMVVREEASRWATTLAETGLSTDAPRVSLELLSVAQLRREWERRGPTEHAAAGERLLKLAEFHCAHPAAHPNYAAASDVLRAIGLALWGGIYLDTDRAYPAGVSAPCPGCALSDAQRQGDGELGIATVTLQTQALAATLAAGPPFFPADERSSLVETVMQYESGRWLEQAWPEGVARGSMVVPNNNLLSISSLPHPEAGGHPVGLFLLERMDRSVRRFFDGELEARVAYSSRAGEAARAPLVGPRLSAVICPSGQFYSEAFLHGPAFYMGLLGDWFLGRLRGPITSVRGHRASVEPERRGNPRPGPASPGPPLRRVLPAYGIDDERFPSRQDAVYPYGWISQRVLPTREDVLALVELMEETTGRRRFTEDGERQAFSERMEELLASYGEPGG